MKVQLAGGVTEHELYAYEPESEPLLHVRDCGAHDCPYGTVEDWYAVTEEPLVTVLPLNEQFAGEVQEI